MQTAEREGWLRDQPRREQRGSPPARDPLPRAPKRNRSGLRLRQDAVAIRKAIGEILNQRTLPGLFPRNVDVEA